MTTLAAEIRLLLLLIAGLVSHGIGATLTTLPRMTEVCRDEKLEKRTSAV